MPGAQGGELTYLPASGQGLGGAFPALINQDSNGVATTPSELWIKNASGLYVPVSSTTPLPTSLSGSKVIGPTLIATIPYTAFTASQTQYKACQGVLTRAATHRTVYIANQLNESLSSATLFMYDSTINTTPGLVPSITVPAPNAGGSSYPTAAQYPELSAHVDSIDLGLGMGATSPTSGNVLVYAIEILGS